MLGNSLNKNIYKSFSLTYHQRIKKAIIMWPKQKKTSHLYASFLVGTPVYLLQMSTAQVDINVLNCEMRKCRNSSNATLRRNLQATVGDKNERLEKQMQT
jgi:hypothetical protein